MEKKKLLDYIKWFAPILVIGVVLYLFIRTILRWTQLDVRGIDVDYESPESAPSYFVYEGKTYREIAVDNGYATSFNNVEKECIGRAKGTFLVLYTMKTDPEHTTIVAESPIKDVLVYSCKFDAIPEDGEVTGVYVNLGIPGVHGEGSMHLSIKKEAFEDENLELFQRLWTERYKNEPIEYVHPYSTDNDVTVSCFFCFNGCPVSGEYLHISCQDNKWYFVESEYESDLSGKSQDKHWGYLVDDPEMVAYLNEFMQYEETENENWN